MARLHRAEAGVRFVHHDDVVIGVAAATSGHVGGRDHHHCGATSVSGGWVQSRVVQCAHRLTDGAGSKFGLERCIRKNDYHI